MGKRSSRLTLFFLTGYRAVVLRTDRGFSDNQPVHSANDFSAEDKVKSAVFFCRLTAGLVLTSPYTVLTISRQRTR